MIRHATCAAVGFLTRYTDADTDSDIHLLDNWGLMHALFRDCPALVRPAKGWDFAPDRSIADLAPAPYREEAWAADAPAVFAILLGAQCRTVRQWAVWMLRRHHEGWLAAQSVATLLKLADHPDPDLSNLGFDLLEKVPDLSTIPVEEWLTRLGGDDLEKLQRLSSLLTRRLDPAHVTITDTLRLAGYRSKPVAELGLSLVKRRTWSADDATAILALVQAECDRVRPELMGWLRETLLGFGPVRAEWLLEFLDSKHADVRAAGWAWLNESPLRDDPTIWHRLAESPYDDVREPLVTELARRAGGGDPDLVRLLWATVLLNIARGGRHKPGVVAQVVGRLKEHPAEADRLLPLLAMALRSLAVRSSGPGWPASFAWRRRMRNWCRQFGSGSPSCSCNRDSGRRRRGGRPGRDHRCSDVPSGCEVPCPSFPEAVALGPTPVAGGFGRDNVVPTRRLRGSAW